MDDMIPGVQLLKLGGSLITDKNQPHSARLEVITRLASEIAAAKTANPNLKLIVGHGSGSFGHVPAKKYGTRLGVHHRQEWLGFVEVWREAQALNRIVMDALDQVGVPAIGFSPVASIVAENGRVLDWDLRPIQTALRAGIFPVVFGDVVFDLIRGGTILSTEDLFTYLAYRLQPERILLAGIEVGVWADYPSCTELVDLITPPGFAGIASKLSGSRAADVTGGMLSKVELSLEWLNLVPELNVHIFSGDFPGAVLSALSGEAFGTLIRAD